MRPTRRSLLAAVPATALLSGCSLASALGGREATPPYVVENTSDQPRSVELGVWNVGRIRPVEDRPDDFRKEFETAVADGSVEESSYEWRERYRLDIEPGSEAAPLSSSDASGLLYVRASADNGAELDAWVPVEAPGEAFFVHITAYANGMGFTTGEYD